MARPIEPTPVLKGKDAERLLKDVKRTPEPSAKTTKRLDGCAFAYHSFYAKLKKAKEK